MQASEGGILAVSVRPVFKQNEAKQGTKNLRRLRGFSHELHVIGCFAQRITAPDTRDHDPGIRDVCQEAFRCRKICRV